MTHDGYLAGQVDAHEGLAGLRRAHESTVADATAAVVEAAVAWRATWRPGAVRQSPEYWSTSGRLSDAVDDLDLARGEAAEAGVIV